MNSKKKNFLVAQAIVVAFVLLLTMIANYFLITLFGFSQDTFVFITLGILVLGLVLFFALSKPLLEPLFKSDENLQKALKETIHELNIPVSTIDLNSKMLEKTITDEKSLKRLNRIKKANNSLLKLYEDMEYSIKKEIDRVDSQDFYLKDTFEISLEKIEDIRGDITINTNIENILLHGDEKGFIKTIDNLLSNAIKYNVENGVIDINFKDNILTIYNTGKSIDTKNLFIIFDEYFQENSQSNGFGLGLNMVKEYCDKHHIIINIESKKEGTSFNLDLTNIL